MVMQKYSTHNSESGFTLIELLIVIAIIGILAAIAIPQFNQYKIRGYDAHSKQALKDMHLLCNAYWLDTDSEQGCDLPIIKDTYYGFNQNTDVVATLPSSPLNNFCASAKHNSSPNTYSIDSASLISEGAGCGGSVQTASVEVTKVEEPTENEAECRSNFANFTEKYQALATECADGNIQTINYLRSFSGNNADRTYSIDCKNKNRGSLVNVRTGRKQNIHIDRFQYYGHLTSYFDRPESSVPWEENLGADTGMSDRGSYSVSERNKLGIGNPYKEGRNRVLQPGRCSGPGAWGDDGHVGFLWVWPDPLSKKVTMCSCCKTPCADNKLRFEFFD
jgi:type IV pilus assembly protein PilA